MEITQPDEAMRALSCPPPSTRNLFFLWVSLEVTKALHERLVPEHYIYIIFVLFLGVIIRESVRVSIRPRKINVRTDLYHKPLLTAIQIFVAVKYLP